MTKWKTTKMEDDQNGRQPKWKTTEWGIGGGRLNNLGRLLSRGSGFFL